MSSPEKRRMNPVEELSFLDEAIKKERLHSKIHEHFTLNPRSCNS